MIDPSRAGAGLLRFAQDVEDEDLRAKNESLAAYYSAARSASNDTKPRETRIRILKSILESAAPAQKGSKARGKKKVTKRAGKKR